jgi:hypothetical protein
MLNLWRLLAFQSLSPPKPSLPIESADAATSTLTLHQPRPDVRLNIANGHTSLYAFPSHSNKSPYPGYLYLRSLSPAEISYVLGPDRRLQLIPPSSNDRFLKTWSYIPISPATLEDEPKICLRMKRCGAVRIIENFDLGMLDNPEFENQETENRIMVWPDGGSLWLLTAPS